MLMALLLIGGIYTLLSNQFTLGPRYFMLGLIAVLVLGLIGALYVGHRPTTRTLSLLLLGVITLGEAVSASALIMNILTATRRISEVPHATALVLLRDGALVWLVNVLTFSVWYWEIDDGGPLHRLRGYQSSDLLFPQKTTGNDEWMPHFVDYLFLSFNTSTAFSPTDTLALSMRIKLLMMVQALISLTVIAIIAARAINTL
jgi:hypothetical protein